MSGGRTKEQEKKKENKEAGPNRPGRKKDRNFRTYSYAEGVHGIACVEKKGQAHLSEKEQGFLRPVVPPRCLQKKGGTEKPESRGRHLSEGSTHGEREKVDSDIERLGWEVGRWYAQGNKK